MGYRRIEAAIVIDAPAERLYGIVADYREGHPRILPRPFVRLTVEQGGVGAGTTFRCEMRVLGRIQSFRGTVEEPEPGRVILERDETHGYVTTFTFDPLDAGRTRVTIATELRPRHGILAAVEHVFAARFLRPIYVRELAKLAEVAAA